MYNRYIGNTGKYYRVDTNPGHIPAQEPPEHISPPPHRPPASGEKHPESGEKSSKWDLKSISNISGNVRNLIKDKLPESIDVGDILLVLILLFLFLEGDDDEVLIILGILIFTWVKPLFSKEEEED